MSTEPNATPKASWRQKLFPNRAAVIWPLLYAATVLALLGWYELLPRLLVYRELQGTWQLTSGKGHTEKAVPAYWHIVGKQTDFYDKRRNSESADWHVRKSTISVRPARDFFVVTRNYNFGKPGVSYDQDYFIYLKDDKFYMISGIGQANAPDYLVSMVRRVDNVPEDLQARIKQEE